MDLESHLRTETPKEATGLKGLGKSPWVGARNLNNDCIKEAGYSIYHGEFMFSVSPFYTSNLILFPET
jgi:hypothetical protein